MKTNDITILEYLNIYGMGKAIFLNPLLLNLYDVDKNNTQEVRIAAGEIHTLLTRLESDKLIELNSFTLGDGPSNREILWINKVDISAILTEKGKAFVDRLHQTEQNIKSNTLSYQAQEVSIRLAKATEQNLVFQQRTQWATLIMSGVTLAVLLFSTYKSCNGDKTNPNSTSAILKTPRVINEP